MEDMRNEQIRNRLDFKIPTTYRKRIDYICEKTYKTKTGFLKEMIDKNYEEIRGEEELLIIN